MELRQLRYFLAVAEELHFGRAAQRMGIEQSPLSRAIKELERDLGIPLFLRTSRNTCLTAAGQTLLASGRRILSAVDDTRKEVLRGNASSKGQLRIGLCDGLAPPRFSRLIACWRREEPDVEIRIVDRPFAQQVEEVRLGLLDAGFVLGASNDERVRTEALWTDSVAAVLPEGHALAARAQLHLSDVAREPLILYHPDCLSGVHTQLDKLVRSVNPRPVVVDYALNLNTLVTMVGAGFGIGFASSAQADAIRQEGVLVKTLSGCSSALTTFLIRRVGQDALATARFIARARLFSTETGETF